MSKSCKTCKYYGMTEFGYGCLRGVMNDLFPREPCSKYEDDVIKFNNGSKILVVKGEGKRSRRIKNANQT